MLMARPLSASPTANLIDDEDGIDQPTANESSKFSILMPEPVFSQIQTYQNGGKKVNKRFENFTFGRHSFGIYQ